MMNHLIDTLQDKKGWVCWRKEVRDGKATKVPYAADGHNSHASVADPSTWSVYQDAAAMVQAGHYDGVGFVLCEALPYVCVDLDHCLDRVSGEVQEPAASIVAMLEEAGGTYMEISPSGEGLHLWGVYDGALPGGKTGIHKKDIEIYRDKRYMTVTGNAFRDFPLANVTSAVNELIEKYQLMEKSAEAKIMAKAEAKPEGVKVTLEAPAAFDDDFLIERARAAKNGSKFSALFDYGDTSAYENDTSKADAALLEMLAYWTNGNALQMERMFMKSKLRERLGRKKHKDNGYIRDFSIPNALKAWEAHGGKCYEPKGAIVISRADPGAGTARERPAGKEDVLSLDPVEWTDTANAERIAAWYGDVLKYCTDYKSFVEFTGKKWEKITEPMAHKYARQAMNRIRFTIEKEREQLARKQQEAIKEGKELQDLEEERQLLDGLDKLTVKNKNNPPIKKALEELKGINVCRAAMFDADPLLLNCDNGLLNLETGELSPHDPAQMCMKCTGVAYVAEPSSHLWRDTVETIIPNPETRHYLQKVFGAALQGQVREQECYFFVGKGGNGKGIVTESVKAALGDYAITINPEIILQGGSGLGAGDRATPTVISMKGARVVVCGESDFGRTLGAAILKRLTGGDTLTGRACYGENVEFAPSHTFFFSTNYEPDIPDACDQGLKRRLREIKFTETFSVEKGNMDVGLSARLKRKEALEEVLGWLVEGFKMYREEGLKPPPDVEMATAKFFDTHDEIGEFLKIYCVEGEECKVKRSDLSRQYRMACREDHGPSISKQQFNASMRNHGFEERKINGIWYFIGVELKSHTSLSAAGSRER